MIKLDNKLLERVKNDDKQAITEIYKTYSLPLYYQAYSILLNSTDAKEAVSETFVRFLKYKHTIKQPAFYTWLSTATRNVCYDMHNGKLHYYNKAEYQMNNDIETSITEPIDYVHAPQVIYQQIKTRQLVNRILTELPPQYKDVLLLHNDGYTCSEIGQKIGKTENAIKHILSRARKKARGVYYEITKHKKLN
ncbi:MAG: RNA polymerase sigma factor [Candidatus Latescibacteria bacterium]|nr:RNA polymerase sigma factor [Candidatus Latescibacterota bacterium]